MADNKQNPAFSILSEMSMTKRTTLYLDIETVQIGEAVTVVNSILTQAINKLDIMEKTGLLNIHKYYIGESKDFPFKEQH